MKKKYISLAMAAMLTLGTAGLANASNAISYTALDLEDVIVGEDRWQYSYTVTGDSFDMGTAFAVEFEKTMFVLSESPDSQPTAPNNNWYVQTLTSNFNPDVFVYDAYAEIDNASLANQFIVDFVWKGGSEGPGSQFFVVYNEYETLQIGDMTTATAAPVPVPAAIWLLGSGLAALGGSRLRKRN